MSADLKRPIRVVMFGSGPELNRDAQRFLCRLQDHPEIELVGAFCQARGQSWCAVFSDLWRRRRWLAFPLFVNKLADKAIYSLLHLREASALRGGLKAMSRRIHFIPDIHAPYVLDEVRALEPDLGLIYGSPILKPELFGIPRLGTLGIHHGKVPEYRGNKTTFWAMYNGEPIVGVTIQKVDKGLDTGSIVKTGQVKADRRSYRSVVHELEGLGLDLYVQAILDVKDGVAEFKPQPSIKGKLYRNPKVADFLRFWSRQIQRRLGMAARP